MSGSAKHGRMADMPHKYDNKFTKVALTPGTKSANDFILKHQLMARKAEIEKQIKQMETEEKRNVVSVED